MNCEIFIGFDSREAAAYEVCVRSIRNHCQKVPQLVPLLEPHLRGLGLYTRRHERREGRQHRLLPGCQRTDPVPEGLGLG